MFIVVLLAFGIGIIAGLRALTAPAAVSWGARMATISVTGTWLAFMGYTWTPWIFTALALGEIVNDKLPATPSRKVPMQFSARVLMGALSGAAIAISHSMAIAGILAGVLGAVVGTLGGAALRSRLAKAFGRDLPAALLEDAVAILGGILMVGQVR